jgi:DNA polymerase III delta prime subunit
MSARDSILELKRRIGAAVVGQESVIDQLLVALLANGHLLLEGLPGLAKTRTIKTLAGRPRANHRSSRDGGHRDWLGWFAVSNCVVTLPLELQFQQLSSHEPHRYQKHRSI